MSDTDPRFHLAQVNIGRVRGEMTDPVMADFAAALPEIKQKLTQLGFEPTSIGGAQFQRDVVAELKTWAEIIAKAGIKTSP